MKKITLIAALLLTSCSTTPPIDITDNDSMCSSEYSPVCGRIEIQCITTPCDPVLQTFGNMCEAKRANASEIEPGVCSL